MKIFNSKLWEKLMVSFLTVLVVVFALTLLANAKAGTINSELRIETYKIVTDNTSTVDTNYWPAVATTAEEVEALCREACESSESEGLVLLKNDNNTLPLAKGSKASFLLSGSSNVFYATHGPGRSSADGCYSFKDACEQTQALKINETLFNFYLNGEGKTGRNLAMIDRLGYKVYKTNEPAWSKYSQSVKDSIQAYGDVAIFTITRMSGEGDDVSAFASDGIDGSYLTLTQSEIEIFEKVAEMKRNGMVQKIVVLLNSAVPMSCEFLFDETLGIDAAMWIGCPGGTGTISVVKALVGDVNPSGRVSDTFLKDNFASPVGANWKVNDGFANVYTNADALNLNATQKYYGVYQEGIYVGYRYFETRYEDYVTSRDNVGLYNYNKDVAFPFGYGLSYTTFEWTITGSSFADTETLTWTGENDQEFFVKVTVKNTGSVAGKDVVELYVTAPYTAGEIEKAHVVLVGFAKTSLLNPGQSEEVEIKFNGYDFASYDYSDANNNTFKGYELDDGDYEVKVMKNSHTEVAKLTFRLTDNVQYRNDTTTGYLVENLYDDVSNEENYGMESKLSRANWTGTYPVNEVLKGSDAERTVPTEFMNKIKSYATNNPIVNDTSIEMPNQAEVASPASTLKIYDLIMFDENEEVERDAAGTIMVNYDDPRWEEYLDILTVGEMMDFTMKGAFKTTALQSIAAIQTFSTDGPVGFVYFMAAIPSQSPVYETCSYASECVIAATWNTELAYKMGLSVGNEGVIGDKRGSDRPYSGWYAPAVNIHRTPFSGRNFEYYSEDPFISGKLAAQVVLGARSRGVYCQVKHFCVNDQETNRSGVCTWLTEQSLREIYLKPFEFAVKEGGAMGIMSSFNRIGSLWTGGDYRLLTTILRNEWGFKGLVITDFNTEPFMDTKQMAYAGGDLNLATLPAPWEVTTPQDYVVLRAQTKNILYTLARSNAMNGLGEGGYYIVYYAWWETTLMMLVIGLILGSAVWGFFAVRKALKS